jgi:hypothetical protein
MLALVTPYAPLGSGEDGTRRRGEARDRGRHRHGLACGVGTGLARSPMTRRVLSTGERVAVERLRDHF